MKKRSRVLQILVMVICILGWNASMKVMAQSFSVRTLKFTTMYVEGQELYETVRFFTDQIEKRTQGRIKFQAFLGSSLVPTNQFVASVNKGILDVAFAVPTYEGGLWPITNLGTIFGAPNVTYEKWRTIHDQVRDIMNKNIAIDVVILGMPHVVSYHLNSRKPVTGKIADFKGLLVRSAGTSFDASMKALGSAPVTIAAPETYMALQRGTIDAAMNSLARYVESKVFEAAPYILIIPRGPFTFGQYFIINKTVWNSLATDIQKVLVEVGTEVVGFTNDRSSGSDKKVISETLPKLGIKPVTMPEEENRLLLQKLATVWDPEIAKLGKPAEEIAKILGIK